MKDNLENRDDLDQKYNKSKYPKRFGISYTKESRKNLDFDYSPNKKNKKKVGMNSSIDNSSKLNSMIHNDSARKIRSSKNVLFNEAEQIEIDKIYGINGKEYEDILPIHNFDKITKCSVLKYGIKKSTEEIEYSYCKTCDYNFLKPICLCCINLCHKGHLIKYIFNKGRIKCSCGEKNHIGIKLSNHNNNNDIHCLCNEWNFVAKLKFYYINNKKEPICILCHHYCQDDNEKDKIVRIKNGEEIPKCSCKKEITHYDNRIISEKILDLIKESTEFEVLLHPVQIMNMIFKSSNNFKQIFEYFETFTNELNNTQNLTKLIANFSKAHFAYITYTNIINVLIILEKIIKKGSISGFMCYYNKEAINYFSFNIIKKLLVSLEESKIEEKLFWALTNKYLYLFHKIYINTKTLLLVKFKVSDLKNISLCQRMIISNENAKAFKESDEIISFLIKFLVDIIYKRFSLDSIECIREIMSIFRKLSSYNLIRINHMTQICISISKCCNYIRITRNSFTNSINDVKSKNDLFYFNKITLKLYYIIIKMFLNFIYNYNDIVIRKIVYDREKYPDFNYIDFDNVCFVYSKNEFGRLMFKRTIYILASIQEYHKDIDNKRTILIQRIGMEILQYSLNKNDNYYINMIGSLSKINYYFYKSKNFIFNINNNQYYKELQRQSNLITNSFYKYFDFEISIEEIIEIVNESLNYILGDSVQNILKFEGDEIDNGFNLDQQYAIFSTNYYSLISKVISILSHHQNRKENYENNIDEQNEINNITNGALVFNKYQNHINNAKVLFKYQNEVKTELSNFIDYLPLNEEDKIIKKILYLYFCFVSNSSDNSFLVLSFYIFIEIIKLPIKYSQIIFKLFYVCIKNIENNLVIVEQSYIIKRLYNYLEKLIDRKTSFINNTLLFCIYYYLQILEIIVFNLQPSSVNVFIYKVQFILYSLDKKYNLVNKFFNMKESDINIQSGSPKNKNNKSKKESESGVEAINEKKSTSTKHQKSLNFEFKNILKNVFLLFIKLINNCFDFSIDSDRQKINEILNVEKVIFALKHYRLSLDLRTEFLRFLRKIMLDLKLDFSENRLYTEIIINNEDNLNYIKYNPLINNLEYPTRLLSFLNDFYNINAKCGIKEKIEAKKNDKNLFESNILKENEQQQKINENCDISISEGGDIKESGFFADLNYKKKQKSNSISIAKFPNKELAKFKNELEKNKNEFVEKGKRFSLANYNKALNFNRKRYSLKVGNILKLNNNNYLETQNSLLLDNTDIISEMNSEEEKSLNDSRSLVKSGNNENISEKTKEKRISNLLNIQHCLKSSNDIIPEELNSKIGNKDLEQSFLKVGEIKSKSKSNKNIIKLKFKEDKSKNFLDLDKKSENFPPKKSLDTFYPSRISSNGDQKEDTEITNKKEFNEIDELNKEDLDELQEAIEENNNETFYNKCKEMNILENAFNEEFYNVINNELRNYKKYIENVTLNSQEKIEYLRNYIENGLLIPIIYYFKKIFTLANFFTGKEMVKLYSLVEKSMSLKIDFLKLKCNLWKNSMNEENIFCNDNQIIQNIFFDNDEIINEQYYYYTNYKYSSIIDGECFINDKYLRKTEESYDFLLSDKNIVFDYSLLYQIVEKEFFCMLKDKKVLNISYNFKEKNVYRPLDKKKIREEEKILNEKNYFKSDIQKRILKAIIIYKHSKLACYNEHNSSFLSILSEISLEYEQNYRSLLLNLLIIYSKDMNLKSEFMDTSFYLLFKLLCLQTVETQNEIMNLLGGRDSEDCGFLDEFSQILFYRIILLLFDFLNPPDKIIQSNYYISCNLLNIFRFLCVNNNYFFQLHFVKSLSYTFTENPFSFFKFNIEEVSEPPKEKKDNGKPNSNKEQKIFVYNVKFYDFFLFLLTKIILISNWDKSNDINKPSPFFYDFFTSVLDLLTEIIQESRPELLSILFDNIDDKFLEMIGCGVVIEKYKTNESFEVFIKTITNILFQENSTKFILELKNSLIHYINSILEEKIDNNIIKKYIKKYLNINNIYRNISKILKTYYLTNNKKKTLKNMDNKIKKLPKRINSFRKTKDLDKRRNTVATLKARRRSTSKKIKKTQINETSTSNIKLINTIIDVNLDLKKNLFLLNLNKEKKYTKMIPHEGNIVLKETKMTYKHIDKIDSSYMELKKSKLIFGKSLYHFFKKKFYEDRQFNEKLEFQLCNSFYRFIKILRMKKGKISEKKNKLKDLNPDEFLLREEDHNIIKHKPSKKTNNKDNDNYEKDSFEKFYIGKFFEGITKILEIRTRDRINKTIIYTKIPEMKNLSKGTKLELMTNINRDNETSKKYDLMRIIEYLFKEIKYNYKYNNKWDIWLSRTNFYYLELTSYAFALMYNFILLFTIKGDTQITKSDTLKERIQNKSKIQSLINYSINDWNIIYYAINWIYLILNGIFIGIWIRYKLPLYYRLDKVKYRELFKKDKSKKLNILEKIYILLYMCLLQRNYIKMILYESFVCIICLIINSEIIYGFFLLPILYLNKTLKSLVISIQLQFKQFVVTFFFTFILIYVFTNIYYFIFNSDFVVELNYFKDNYCKELIFAVLNALDYGLRARGGLADSAIRISFSRNKLHYIKRLIIDDLFFLLIVILMIDMVFGIIIKSFDELRHRNQKYKYDKLNNCFICHCNRKLLDKMRINFNEHVTNNHNIWNYVEYMLSLKLKDLHDLSAINQYVRIKIDKKDISWLPTYKDINKDNDSFLDDKNLVVFHENIINYKIKSNLENTYQ